MQEATTQLFNQKTIAKFCSNIVVGSPQQKAAEQWLELLESGLLDKEKRNYFRFALVVLQDILGYAVREDLDFEAGDVEFSFRNPHTGKSVCIEVKGASTKDLFADQHRIRPERQTPIKQTWDYMGSSNFDYGIATNYRDFILIDKSKGYSRYHQFDIISIKNNETKLKEFIAIFSRRSLLDEDFISKLHMASMTEEREFTRQFYKLYHETRLMLVKEFQNNGQANTIESLHYAQLFLNRLIFLFFVQASGKIRRRLFNESILQSLNPLLVSEHSRYACDTILNLFEILDKGSETPVKIFGYNGGLFRDRIPSGVFFKDMRDDSFFEDVLLDSTLKRQMKPDELSKIVIDRFRDKLNPIISNLLILSSFDFESDLNVNILGHIFEQSLTDLEELQGLEAVSKRKKEGIYYTPRFITDFICRSTIIPYLSKSGTVCTIEDLIEEYRLNVAELEDRFRAIKILDPACGSGAFLLNAVDILLEIHRQIRMLKESEGKYVANVKGHAEEAKLYTLEKWNEEEEAQIIIQNNIFGVDVNEESVEITRLSLFLRIASNDRKLIDLSKNIRVGNSLIDDKRVDKKAFVWQEEFKGVFEKGGFDVVIGNPPYLRIQGLHESHESATTYFENKYDAAQGRYDYYVLFIERGAHLIREGGVLGFIVPHKFMNSSFGKGIREFLAKGKLVREFVSFGHNFVFDGVTTYTGTLFVQKSQKDNLLYTQIGELKTSTLEGDLAGLTANDFVAIPQDTLSGEPWVLSSGEDLAILKKINESGPIISEYFDRILEGVITGDDAIYFLTPVKDNGSSMTVFSEKTGTQIELEKDLLRPLLVGEDVKRYKYFDETASVLLFPYIIENGKQRPLKEDELKQMYPLAYGYLSKFRDHLINLRRKFKTNPEYWYALHRPRQKKWYDQEKIVTPEISFGCNMTLDRNGLIHNAKVYSFLKKNSTTVDIRYLLAVLNSKLFWFFLKNTGYVLRGGFFTFKTRYMERFHIPKPKPDVEQHICREIESILDMSKQFYKVYSRLVRRVENRFQIESRKSLEELHKLTFGSFLKRFSGDKLSLREQDDWEDYFKQHTSELLRLESEINRLDSQLNRMVYGLYGLNDTETRRVEEGYPQNH